MYRKEDSLLREHFSEYEKCCFSRVAEQEWSEDGREVSSDLLQGVNTGHLSQVHTARAFLNLLPQQNELRWTKGYS